MAVGRVTAGRPEPLGVTPEGDGVNVAVLSTTAAAIDLCLFDDADRETRVRLPERTGEVFHGHVAGVRLGERYGLRAHGPFAPARGLRFDPGKLLVDPYAQALDRPFRLDPVLFAPPEAGLDSAFAVPKAIVTAPAEPSAPPLRTPWARTVIYEAHVRGLTMRHPRVPGPIRGTFAALAHPAVVEHLARLGVTTLELLPVAAWIDERHLPALGLTNYWGYNPVAPCAPDPRLAPGGWAEVAHATRALAEAGIETVLDVVFNHTGESDELGPTVSLRGLDNPGYYRLAADNPALYVNDAGTGNILACDRPQSVHLVMEALRTWARRGGIAGFRFDLATVLGRRADGFDPAAPLLAAIGQDPELRELKLIAEPWDCGPGGYQLGRFPSAWGEWNDRFRDTARRFWRGSGASLGDFAARLAGSQDAFGARGRPSRSVNFVTAHDGFTLADLVSHSHKHNQANGENNRDGSDHEIAWNNGVEGPTDDPAVQARRQADQRALLATLLLARGTPMLAMGAELGQTQGGNNNAYVQDNATSWLDWDRADAALALFTARLIRARAEHPALHADRFLTGEAHASPWPDVAWRRPDGEPLSAADWDAPDSPALQVALAEPQASGGVDRVAILINRGGDPLPFNLPEPADACAWRILADTSDPERDGLAGETLTVAGRAIVLLAQETSRRRPSAVDDAALASLAEAAGIAPDWWGLDGERRQVSPQTQRALLDAMGFPAATPGDVREARWRLERIARAPLPAVRVVPAGAPASLRLPGPEAWLTLETPDGAVRAIAVLEGAADLPPLPPGRYRLRHGQADGLLIAAPASGYEPPELAAGARIFGLGAQLYAVRGRDDAGIGDFAALDELGDLARSAGAQLIAVNPLHALFPDDRERASPYYPSDRRFLDPIYLHAAALPPAGGPLVDYPAVWAAKRAALEAEADAAASDGRRAEIEAFARVEGRPLADFCAFQVIAEEHPGRPWRDWPEALRDPRSPAVAAYVAARGERLARHQALQWLADRALAEAAARAPGLGLCRDLAVGAAPDGAEAWSAAERLATGVSIGAPPDAFAPQGQVWGLPPPNPHRWRAEGYESFGALIATNMRHAGALRIDHVLGLSRLFWVPAGAEGADGAYVAYPRDDLLGVLALESQAARCLVVGEDLGTVPDGLREALAERRVYRYSLLPFEREGEAFHPPSAYPDRALACVSTHDLPPLAGWWAGTDDAEREALGLVTGEAAQAARERRAAEKAALLQALADAGIEAPSDPTAPFSVELAAAVHAFAARAESRILLVQLEDLAGETVGVNLPGTDRERPNWRRRLGKTLGELPQTETWRAILEAVRAERG